MGNVYEPHKFVKTVVSGAHFSPHQQTFCKNFANYR